MNTWPTTNHCSACDVFSVEAECWMCGRVMVRRSPRWNGVHVFHADRRKEAIAGRIVSFEPVDDLL